MLTCRQIRQLHDAFVDGELSPSLAAEVHAHLLQCPACQQQVEMLRAVGHVIAHDDEPAPALDSGFAQKVVASIAQSAPAFGTAKPQRKLAWRVLRRASLPAAAAVMFMAIVMWPKEEAAKQTKVLGVKAVKPVVDPALSAVADTRTAAKSLNQLLELSVDQARSDVRQGLDKMEAIRQRASKAVSITDILLMPFDDMLTAPAAVPEAREPGVVRF